MILFKNKTPRELSFSDLSDLASLNTENLPVYLRGHAEAIVASAKEAVSGTFGSEQEGLDVVVRTMEMEGVREGPGVINLQDYRGR